MTTITADMVKQLREETGAAILDCKNTLEETGGDFEKAKEILAEKGLAKAAKKAGREVSEGIVEVYSHTGGRVGVLVELNCETDFVANTDKFQAYAHDIALHVAFHDPLYLDTDSIPEDVLEAKKKEFYDEAKEQGKPDNVIEKIVEGKLDKYLADSCLLMQPFVKDEDITVADLVQKAIAELQENIRVSRFARFEVGNVGDDEETDEE